MIACGQDATTNPIGADGQPTVPHASASFVVDDVHIVRVPDDIAVHWDLVYDASGTTGEPIRCRWRIVNREGEVVQVGVVNIAVDADDAVAGTVYPDEVPGVPESGEVRC